MNDSKQLYNILKETFLLLDDGDQRLVSRFNLSVRRYYTLYWIAKEPGISFSDLSLRMLVDKSNVTRIIKAMEHKGYVFREAHEIDGRSHRLYLTDKGQTVQQEATMAHAHSIESRMNLLNTTYQDTLENLLIRLNDCLRQELNESQAFLQLNARG